MLSAEGPSVSRHSCQGLGALRMRALVRRVGSISIPGVPVLRVSCSSTGVHISEPPAEVPELCSCPHPLRETLTCFPCPGACSVLLVAAAWTPSALVVPCLPRVLIVAAAPTGQQAPPAWSGPPATGRWMAVWKQGVSRTSRAISQVHVPRALQLVVTRGCGSWCVCHLSRSLPGVGLLWASLFPFSVHCLAW